MLSHPSIALRLLWGFTLIGQAAWAAEPVEVEVASGRTFVALVDARTDEQQLWLRFERGQSQLLRPIAWEAIVAAHQDGRPLSSEQLQALATTRERSARRASPQPASGTSNQPAVPTVGWLALDAYLANWDQDANPDGVIVEVMPRDELGSIAPVRATLEVELYALPQERVRRVKHVRRIGRWVRRLEPDDFGHYGAPVRLAFQAVQPEFDEGVEPVGLVKARLVVPGQGVFDASRADVRIRPYSGFRDRLEQATGSRFVQGELTVPAGDRMGR